MTGSPTHPNPVLVLAEQLRGLSVPELVDRYTREWGRPPRVRHGAWLRKQIARRVHERQHGGLSKLALERLEALISEIRVPLDGPPRPHGTRKERAATPPVRTPAGLAVGTVLERVWRGQRIRVEVTAEGIVHDGTTYSSLSACACAITQTHISGNRFFNVRPTRSAL